MMEMTRGSGVLFRRGACLEGNSCRRLGVLCGTDNDYSAHSLDPSGTPRATFFSPAPHPRRAHAASVQKDAVADNADADG